MSDRHYNVAMIGMHGASTGMRNPSRPEQQRVRDAKKSMADHCSPQSACHVPFAVQIAFVAPQVSVWLLIGSV
jgi:hypothetical protein